MRRFLLIFLGVLFFLGSVAHAKTYKVISLENFSTLNPSQTYKVQFIENEKLDDGTIYEEGTILSGEVIKINKPTRGKRNAYFEFVPTEVTIGNKTQRIENPQICAKVVGYAPFNTKGLAEKAAKGSLGLVLKSIIGPIATFTSGGISFIQGFTADENGNKIKAGLVKAYEDSPLVFFEEGKQLNVSPGDLILLKIKKLKSED